MDEQPHMHRILDFSKENIHAASNEILALIAIGHKSRIHTTKQFARVLKSHLPNALQELQEIRNVRETLQKEITQNQDKFKVINAENMKLREKVRRLAQENDELVQELSEMKGAKSTHNIMFASKSENTQEMNVSFELIHQNKFMKEQLFYKEKETATLKESCKTSTNLEMHVYRLQKEKKDLEDRLNHVLVMEKEEKKTYIHLQSEFRESIGKIVNAEEKIKLQPSEISLLKLENDKTEQLKKENNDLYLAVCNYIRGKKVFKKNWIKNMKKT